MGKILKKGTLIRCKQKIISNTYKSFQLVVSVTIVESINMNSTKDIFKSPESFTEVDVSDISRFAANASGIWVLFLALILTLIFFCDFAKNEILRPLW